MLPADISFNVWHESGVSLTFGDIRFRGWKFDAQGAQEWGAWEVIRAGAAIANNTDTVINYDNATNKYIGGLIEVPWTNDAGSNLNPVNVEIHRRTQATAPALTPREQSPVLSRATIADTSAVNYVAEIE